MLGNQISDLGISVYHTKAEADFITLANALELAKYYPVTVSIHSWKQVKRFYSFSWVLKGEKALNELRVRKYCDKISGLNRSKT